MPKKQRVENDGRDRLIEHMRKCGWYVKIMGASRYLRGVPDLYAHHKIYGYRWIETKKREGGKLSHTQIKGFRDMLKAGVKIWILSDERDYPRLFKTPNIDRYLTTGTTREVFRGFKKHSP